MTILASFLPVIFNLLVIALVTFSIVKKFKDPGRNQQVKRNSADINNFSEMVSHYNSTKNRRSSGLKQQESLSMKDDRTNDWMARQLRDEALAMTKVSDMFMLKQSHMNNCDAEFIRRFHESSCDAEGIDNGSRKR